MAYSGISSDDSPPSGFIPLAISGDSTTPLGDFPANCNSSWRFLSDLQLLLAIFQQTAAALGDFSIRNQRMTLLMLSSKGWWVYFSVLRTLHYHKRIHVSSCPWSKGEIARERYP
ncbi:uncharacterized protein LOC112497883 [Citrus sinensis]|uniref:uncharacterized protein LOC112497883 n=1 Tax=Citrus sinensis TaxID=2711 RepID=UPI0022796280|nr:uncharacterized protein LOC112497883 [Citrus sinensis]